MARAVFIDGPDHKYRFRCLCGADVGWGYDLGEKGCDSHLPGMVELDPSEDGLRRFGAPNRIRLKGKGQRRRPIVRGIYLDSEGYPLSHPTPGARMWKAPIRDPWTLDARFIAYCPNPSCHRALLVDLTKRCATM